MGVQISLALRDTLDESSVHAGGFDLLELNADRANQFGLIVGTRGYHEKLWAACRRIYGRVPDWFFCRDITSDKDKRAFGTHWDEYRLSHPGVEEVRLEKRAVAARLVTIESKPAAQVSRRVRNTSSTLSGTFSVELEDSISVEHSREIQHGWSAGSETTVGVEIGGELAQSKVKVEQKVSFGYNGSSTKSEAEGEAIAVSSAVEVPLGPLQEGVVSMSCSRGKILVDVDYDVLLVGTAMFCFAQRHHHGKRDHLIDPNRLLLELGKQPVIRVTERMGLGFVSDGEARLEDDAKRTPVSAPAPVQNAELLATIMDYIEEQDPASEHVQRWRRARSALGAHNGFPAMTAAEAQSYADKGWKRWVPVAEAIRAAA